MQTGPMLSDERFFKELVDCTQPGLEGIAAKAAAGDYAACRRIFAAQVRESLRQREAAYFAVPYELPENIFLLPQESEEEVVTRIRKNCLMSVGVPCQFGETVDWCYNVTPNQYREWTWQLNRHNEWKYLANHYRRTKDERDAETVAKQFDSWVKQAIAPEDDVPGGWTLCWRTIECGIRMGGNWQYTLFTFYDTPAFTDDILVDWYKSVWEHGHRMQVNHQGGNWLIMEMNGLAQIGILYPQFKIAEEWKQYALNMLAEELERQVYPDGFQFELATGYHHVVIRNYMRMISVAEVFGVKVPDGFMGRLEVMLEALVRVTMPDRCTPDINDGRYIETRKLVELYRDYYPENVQIAWACQEQEAGGGTAKERNAAGRCTEPDYQSCAFEYAGLMIMRDGWKADSTWALLDAAPFGTGHQHEDKLNLLIYAGGRQILTEMGNYAYNSSETRKYALDTRSHNTIRVDGMSQNRRKTYRWKAEDIRKKAGLSYRIEETYDYAAGVYCEGYGPEQDMDVTHRRSVLFIRKPGEGMKPYFVVIDRLYAEKEHHYEVLWHVDAEEVTICGMKVRADFLHLLSSMDQVKTDGVDVICGQQYPEWQGWKKGPTGIQGDDLPQPAVRYHTVGASQRIVTLLYPDADCPVEKIEAGRCVKDAEIVLVMKDGSRMVLDEKQYAGEAIFGEF